jgi:phosphoribosyl 1,2-cyclic phosphodiesterase
MESHYQKEVRTSMTYLYPLFSGSSGNCTLVSSKGGTVLVDAGVSCKAIVGALTELSFSPEALNGILITHEHSDHIKGLSVFTKRYKLPIYSSREVLDYLVRHSCVHPDCPLFEIASPTEVGGMLVIPFDTPHDSVHSLGFRIETEDGHSIGIATDLGAVTDTVRTGLAGCSLVMLESNYDSAMLQCSSYPYHLKRRISGRRGHLENQDCASYLVELAKSGATQFVLCHLSKENNMPELALQTAYAKMSEAGIGAAEFSLQAARRSEPSPAVAL